MIDYPPDFPHPGRARVERAIAEAQLSFARADERRPGTGSPRWAVGVTPLRVDLTHAAAVGALIEARPTNDDLERTPLAALHAFARKLFAAARRRRRRGDTITLWTPARRLGPYEIQSALGKRE